MKKILLLAASAALVFASCVKTTTVGPKSEDMAQLTIKINGGANTRSIDTVVDENGVAGDEIGSIDLNNATAFVFDAAGDYLTSESLTPATAMGTNGQQLTGTYPVTSKVYVVGNVQGAVATVFGTNPTLAQVKAAVEDVATLPVDFQDAPLANTTGEAVQITTSGTLFIANVELAPVVSRLELVAIDTVEDADGGIIESFDVTGVYVDSTYPSYNYAGQGAGTEVYQSTSSDFSTVGAYFKNEATWSSTGFSVVPVAGSVWGYNLAPSAAVATTSGKNVNRLIIRVENVMYAPDADDMTATITYPGIHFLTVESYSGVTTFERGKIYRVGSDATGAGKFEFDKDDLDPMPNPPTGNVLVNVKVTIQEWVLVTPGAVLM